MNKNNKILEKDRKYVWHPFTQMKEYEDKEHIIIEKGKGIYLYDDKGNKYMDTISSWWVNLHGHSNKRINRAVSEQMKKIEHVNFSGFTHAPAVELAERIIERMNCKLKKLFYSDNGSTAVEIALKMSFQYWKNIGAEGKTKFIYFDRSYHGDTIGAVSVGGVDLFHSIYKPLLFDAVKFSSPNCFKCSMKNIDNTCQTQCQNEMKDYLKQNKDSVCAIIIEPMVQAAGGMIFHKPEFLKELRKTADENGVHLIFDEVATGFGRTGEMWAMEHAGVVPDFIALSKGISAGYMPLAATITTEEIYNSFYSDDAHKTFFHGHSYTANPLACAAGIESLKIFEDEKVMKSVRDKSEFLKEEMLRFHKYEFLENIRILGMISAFDIKKPGLEQKLYTEGFKNGLVLRPLTGVCYYFLQLSITEKEIKKIINKTMQTIETIIEDKSDTKYNVTV